jgi:hypothetical protein
MLSLIDIDKHDSIQTLHLYQNNCEIALINHFQVDDVVDIILIFFGIIWLFLALFDLLDQLLGFIDEILVAEEWLVLVHDDVVEELLDDYRFLGDVLFVEEHLARLLLALMDEVEGGLILVDVVHFIVGVVVILFEGYLQDLGFFLISGDDVHGLRLDII